MKGFTLQTKDGCISGGIAEGVTNIILNCKDGKYDLYFGSLDRTGMIFYTWYASALQIGDELTIRFEENIAVSEPTEIRDYNDQEQMNRLELEAYFRLKAELIKEGDL